MKRFLFVVGCVIMHACAFAAGNHDVSQRMQDYWSSYSNGDFGKAASFILPSDLDDMKTELLPIFVAVGQSTERELQTVARLFFAEVPTGDNSQMSPKQVFVGFNKFIYAANPELFSALQQSAIEVVDVAWSSDSEVVVSYRITIQDTPVSDVERFQKRGEKWYLRLKEPPRDTAIKFRQAFGL